MSRRVSSQDRDAVVALFARLTGQGDYPYPEPGVAADRWVSDGVYTVTLAIDGEAGLAALGRVRRRGQTALTGLAVDPGHRDQGLAGELLVALAEAARGLGCVRLQGAAPGPGSATEAALARVASDYDATEREDGRVTLTVSIDDIL